MPFDPTTLHTADLALNLVAQYVPPIDTRKTGALVALASLKACELAALDAAPVQQGEAGETLMLFTPPPPPENPHAPFVYRDGEIRHDLADGEKYHADVWRTSHGWHWSAVAIGPLHNGPNTGDAWRQNDIVAGLPVADEDEAVRCAVAWLSWRFTSWHGKSA